MMHVGRVLVDDDADLLLLSCVWRRQGIWWTRQRLPKLP
jgi:hypothetical protein